MSEPRPDRCETCRYWRFLMHGREEPVDRAWSVGFCHRYAPRPVVARNPDQETNWPETHSDEWCGEWRAKDETPVINPSAP